jgi:hypothetical protein
MFTSVDVACDASISLGTYLGSDHILVIINTRLLSKYPLIPPQKCLINDDHWHDWNAAILTTLNNKEFVSLDNP